MIRQYIIVVVVNTVTNINISDTVVLHFLRPLTPIGKVSLGNTKVIAIMSYCMSIFGVVNELTDKVCVNASRCDIREVNSKKITKDRIIILQKIVPDIELSLSDKFFKSEGLSFIFCKVLKYKV